MTDLIRRADAIEAVCDKCDANKAEHYPNCKEIQNCAEVRELSALPSAEAEPTVIRSRTFIPTKDFKEWARLIREVNPNAVVIPCDAEVVSAESVSFEDAMQIRNTILFKEYMRGRRDAEAEWIPCSERLPDDDGDYLVWLEDESDHYAVVYFDTGADAFGWWVDHYDPITLGFIESDFCEAKNITAWQPLPTPYKGGDSE